MINPFLNIIYILERNYINVNDLQINEAVYFVGLIEKEHKALSKRG